MVQLSLARRWWILANQRNAKELGIEDFFFQSKIMHYAVHALDGSSTSIAQSVHSYHHFLKVGRGGNFLHTRFAPALLISPTEVDRKKAYGGEARGSTGTDKTGR